MRPGRGGAQPATSTSSASRPAAPTRSPSPPFPTQGESAQPLQEQSPKPASKSSSIVRFRTNVAWQPADTASDGPGCQPGMVLLSGPDLSHNSAMLLLSDICPVIISVLRVIETRQEPEELQHPCRSGYSWRSAEQLCLATRCTTQRPWQRQNRMQSRQCAHPYVCLTRPAHVPRIWQGND